MPLVSQDMRSKRFRQPVGAIIGNPRIAELKVMKNGSFTFTLSLSYLYQNKDCQQFYLQVNLQIHFQKTVREDRQLILCMSTFSINNR